MKRVRKTTLFCILLLSIAAALVGGCSDNPQNAAVKKLQQDTAKAIEQLGKDSDWAAANEQMRSILTGARMLGSQADASLLASADLQAAQAQSLGASLPLSLAEMNQQIAWMAQAFKQLADLISQAQRTEALIALAGTDITALEKWIGADDDPNTLKGKITAAQTQQDQFAAQKMELEKTFSENQRQMLDIEAKADELLRQAQRAESQQRLELETQAFELMKSKKEYTLNAQAAESALSVVNSQLAVVSPHLQRLQEDLAKSEAKLHTLKTAPSHDALAAQKLQIAADIDTQKASLVSRSGQIKNQFESHLGSLDEILALTNDAIDNYSKVRSRDLGYILNIVTGQTYMLAGSLTASKVYLEMDTAARIDGVFRAYHSILPADIVNPAASEPNKTMVQNAYDYFSQAAEAYQEAANLSDTLRNGAKAGEMAALQGQMIAVHQKMRLSDRIHDFETGEKSQAELNALLAKANESGEGFNQTATAMLLSKGLDFVPKLPINTAMILEIVKNEFANWRQLPLPEMETEINRLTPRIAELKTEYAGDEQIVLFLDQEQKAMDEQKAKGFIEQETPAGDANEIDNMNMGFPPQL